MAFPSTYPSRTPGTSPSPSRPDAMRSSSLTTAARSAAAWRFRWRLFSSRSPSRWRPGEPAPAPLRSLPPLRFPPADRLPKARFQVRPRRKAEELAGPRGVETPPRLPVGSGRVPPDLPSEADEIGHPAGEVPDRDLEARADVDGLGRVV